MNFRKNSILKEYSLRRKLHTEFETQYIRTDSAITLIALVITIIVLLILAGVTLSLVTGSDGILGKAEKAVEVTKQAQLEEELQLAISELQMEYYTDTESNASTFEAWVVEKCKNSEGGVLETENGFIEVDDLGNLSYSGSNDYTANFTISENGSVIIEEIITPDGNVNDVRPPVVTVSSTTTNSISFTAIDTVGVVAYAVTESNEQPTDWTTIESTKKYTGTVTGKKANQTYYVWAVDNAGNVSNAATAVTGEVAGASSSNISYTTTWERKQCNSNVYNNIRIYNRNKYRWKCVGFNQSNNSSNRNTNLCEIK